MVIDSLNRIENVGCLKELVDVGIISTTFYNYRKIYLKHSENLQSGLTKMDSYTILSDNFKLSMKTIMKAVKIMSTEI